MSKNFNGYLYALFAIFFWSFNVIYARYLADTFTPFEISFVRWSVPALLFLPFTYKKIYKHRRKFFKAWKLVLILTLTGLGFQNTFIYYAGHTEGAVNMALIGATGPIFLTLLSALFLKEHISLFQILGILITLSGVLVVITKGDLSDIKHIQLSVGALWMLLAAVIFAVYAIAQKKFPANIPPVPAFSAMICLSALMFLPLAAYDYSHHIPTGITKADIVILLILGVFNSGLAYLAWNKSLRLIGTFKTGIMYYLAPVFSSIEAYFLLNEHIALNQIYGMILILSGIALSNFHKKDKG